ncbi:hypothetical protein AALF16_08130 [Bacillus cereus]
MWMVHDHEEGVLLITDNHEEALKQYEKYVKSAKANCSSLRGIRRK